MGIKIHVKKWHIVAIFSVIAGLWFAPNVSAATIDELKEQIEQRNEEIQKLEEDAKKYREEIVYAQNVSKTLKEELSRIDKTLRLLNRDIALTEQKIKKTELEIEELKLEIRAKEAVIKKLRGGLAGLIQTLSENEGESLVEILLKNNLLSDFFQQLDYLSLLEKQILGSLDMLRTLREELQAQKLEAEKKNEEAEDLKKLLGGRRIAAAREQNERRSFLAVTKNQEKTYQQMLREREEKIVALEREIRAIEEEIQITIDPSLLPSRGSGVLGSPLPEIFLASCLRGIEEAKNCLTQFFGYTSFAAVGGYGGKSHNGVDFRASVGTPVFAAETGTVEGTGDTDVGCPKASYGKWILIRHRNGLSTLYAHLSAIGVSSGQEVRRGERIALSGKTGYATGPHLHLSVFATQAVRIESIRSKVCGRLMTLPIAAINGYLNPLDYL